MGGMVPSLVVYTRRRKQGFSAARRGMARDLLYRGQTGAALTGCARIFPSN